LPEDLKSQLNPSQFEAVTATEGPVLVIAGAGSGKTRVIEYRCLHLVQNGVEPESILLLTFTRRSAHEMIERASRNDPRCSRIEGGTFHSFASKVLRRYCRGLGISSSFTIYDEGDAEEAIRRCCNKMGFDGDKEFPKKNELKNVFSLCVNKGMEVDDAVGKSFRDYDDRVDEIRSVQKEYTDYKLRSNCVDYDDLLVYLKVVLEIDEVREKLSEQYRYLMVDEYQDTNGVQADIVRLLAKKFGNVMVVGDDGQSIYGFRGANHRNILDFPDNFTGCRVVKLEANYRSTQSILDMGNAVLGTMTRKFEKKLLSATGYTGEKPMLRRFEDPYDEAAWVVRKVQSLKAEGIDMREAAVLFRTAFASMQLQAELVKWGVRFKLFGGRKFYETAHVRDVISFLRLVANPTDELAWHRVLLLLPGIGVKTVERLLGLIAHYAAMGEIVEKVFAPFASGRTQSEVFARLRDLLLSISRPSLSPGALLDTVIAYYDPILTAKYKKEPGKVKELVMLQGMARRYGSLRDFLADVAVDPDKDAKDGDLEYLTLSTVHSAKGLEWGRVFLISLMDGVFPSARAFFDGDGNEIEEEKRLFYVAVTRAKDELYLSYCAKDGVGEKGVKPSRFLNAPDVKKTFEERAVGSTKKAVGRNSRRSTRRGR
jgi:DNA helicase-2/ATP-dependent DNA helicase PcrA